MNRYPRSFLQLVSLGHFVVAIPLILLALYAFFAMQDMADHYQEVIENVSDSSRLSGQLTEDVQRMELGLRRYEILLEEDSLEDYEEARSEWRKNTALLAKVEMLPPHLAEQLEKQLQREGAAYDVFRQSGNAGELGQVVADIRQHSTAVRDEVRQLIARDQNAIRESSESLLQHLVLALAVALALASLFFGVIRRLLSRLIRRFEDAVLALGRGDLHTPIQLNGPRDVRWLGRRLEWLRRRLLSLENSRVQVLRHVSHELKTPLAAMREGAALLAEQVPGPLTPEQGKILGIVQGNAGRLQDLIEGLLRLQQAGHASERIDYEHLRFDELIEQVLETHRLIAQERRVSVEAKLQLLDIEAGREALLTIVHNLVSNAVKFSPPGGVVRVLLAARGECAVLDVLDEGPGIDEKDMPNLFEPFYRGAAARQVSGAGLGLAIAREFVVAHRGDIQVSKNPRGGAWFRVTLPLSAPYQRRLEDVAIN